MVALAVLLARYEWHRQPETGAAATIAPLPAGVEEGADSAIESPEEADSVELSGQANEEIDASADTSAVEPALPSWWRPGFAGVAVNAFLAEPRDDAWATATEAKIFDALSRLRTGAGAIQAECRTSKCFIQVVNDSCPMPENGQRPDRQIQEALDALTLLQQATDYAATISCSDPAEGFAVVLDRNSPAPPIGASGTGSGSAPDDDP
jgi:hypothetical protein